ncbi:unnamed protein product [Calypogeia fissa]
MESRFYEATRVEAPPISALSKLSLSPSHLGAQLVPYSSRVPMSSGVSSCLWEAATPTFEYIDGVANEQPVDAFHEQLNVVLQCKKHLAQLVERTRGRDQKGEGGSLRGCSTHKDRQECSNPKCVNTSRLSRRPARTNTHLISTPSSLNA